MILGKHETRLSWVPDWVDHWEPNRTPVNKLSDSAEVGVTESNWTGESGDSTVALWGQYHLGAVQTPGHTDRKLKEALPDAKPSSARR